MTKEELQKKVITDLEKKNRVILEWPTSLGKGYVGAKIIASTVLHQTTPKKVLLLVAETLHKNNWKEEFTKQGYESIYDRITVECYASLKNYPNTSWDLIVLDELHHAGTDLRLDILKTISAKKILGLSATLKRDLKDVLALYFGRFVISRITLEDAIDNEWLPEPKIYLIPLFLDTKLGTETYIKEWGTKAKRVEIHCYYKDRWKFLKNKTLYPNVKLVMTCTSWEKYVALCEEISFWEKKYYATNNPVLKNKWLLLSSQRKTYLGGLKTDKAKTLLNALDANNTRYICFCTNIEQAEALNSANCIHSEKKSEVDKIVKNFNEGNINSLYAIGMAQEGMNLKDIESEVIIQLDNSERSTIQRWGRAMRAIEPKIYIFYFKSTRDEEYLKKAIAGIDESFIETITL